MRPNPGKPDKENLSQVAFRKMKQRLDRIDEQEVRKASQAALSLYFWLQAIAAFYLSYSRLKPLLKQRALSLVFILMLSSRF